MSYIKRNLENVVRQVTREYPVLLVTGPRQVAKTTMLQKLMDYDLTKGAEYATYIYPFIRDAMLRFRNCINHLY